jgi:cytochrome c5
MHVGCERRRTKELELMALKNRLTRLMPNGIAVPLSLLLATAAIIHCSADDPSHPSNPTANDGGGASCETDGSHPVVDANTPDASEPAKPLDPVSQYALQMVEEGRKTFRDDTFGDEAFWGDTLKLHQGIAGAAHGGVGPGVSPKTALAVGLKVDVDALPAAVVDALKAGKVDLDSVDTTLTLLQAKAVVGVTGIFDSSKKLVSMGIQCSLCHSTVDDSLAPGVGHRRDGWANRDLNVGAIVNLSPDLSAVSSLLGAPDATVRAVLTGWGPGRFNAQLFLDGKALGPDGGIAEAAALIPPAFGMAGVNLATYTGFGSATYWNAFVANLEMHGKGTFVDPRLNNATQFPVAAGAGFANVRSTPDLITSKLPALQVYQLAIPAPTPPAGSFDAVAAGRGKGVFEGPAKCSTCHVAPLFTEPGWNMHTGAEIGIDDFASNRSPEKRYRTTPLRGLFSHTKGGFYHDGRFPTLDAVVEHYNVSQNLLLTGDQKTDVVEYLKSL